MRYPFYIGALIIAFILFVSCGHKENNVKTEKITNEAQTTTQIDTAGYFIASILNCSPSEVAKYLGKPDKPIKPTLDCDYLPRCDEATYHNREYEALYYQNKLKWLQINHSGHNNKNAISYIGFPSCMPTFSNSTGYFWRNAETNGTATGPLVPIKGLREVCAFPNYILITVETKYDLKFERLNKQ